MDHYITEYGAYMRDRRGYKPNTAQAYMRDLAQFAAFLETEGLPLTQPARITKTAVMAFTLHLQKQNKSAATITRMLSAVRTFFGYMADNGHIRRNPAAEVRAPQINRTHTTALTLAQVQALLRQTEGQSPLAMRDRAMLEVLYGSGLHVSELVALTVNDIDLPIGIVRGGSAARPRVMPLSAPAASALTAYLHHARPALLGATETDVLFTNRNGAALTRQGCWKMIRTCAKRAGLTVAVTPQLLRFSLAAHLVDNGADAAAVRELLGLSGGAAAFSSASGIDMLRKAHPRNL